MRPIQARPIRLHPRLDILSTRPIRRATSLRLGLAHRDILTHQRHMPRRRQVHILSRRNIPRNNRRNSETLHPLPHLWWKGMLLCVAV